MSDTPDLGALREAAEAVQDAIGVLVGRINTLMPEPEPEATENDRRVQITLTVSREILHRMDTLARENGQTRARLFVLAAEKMLRDGSEP